MKENSSMILNINNFTKNIFFQIVYSLNLKKNQHILSIPVFNIYQTITFNSKIDLIQENDINSLMIGNMNLIQLQNFYFYFNQNITNNQLSGYCLKIISKDLRNFYVNKQNNIEKCGNKSNCLNCLGSSKDLCSSCQKNKFFFQIFQTNEEKILAGLCLNKCPNGIIEKMAFGIKRNSNQVTDIFNKTIEINDNSSYNFYYPNYKNTMVSIIDKY